MISAVTIENDALQMDVWPSLGGKVSSLVDKADGYELLFNYPAEFPTGPIYDTAYGKGWYAGWDECFPAVAPGKYVGHPYDGVPIPDHGELWGMPTTATPAKDGIITEWHGLRFGYRLTRKLYLDGPAVRAEYALANLAPFDFHFVWAMHALLAMEVPLQLELPDARGFRLSHDADATDLQKPFAWPRVGGAAELDLSHPRDLPAKRAWKVYSDDPIAAPMVVRYPARERRLSVAFASEDVKAFWGIWVNTGGWAGHRHCALQPTTGRFDQLDRASRDGSAALAGPAGRCEWAVTLTVG